MSRDYKPNRHASRERAPASGGGAFKGILYGLMLGLAIAAAVAWWFNRMPSPFVDKTGATASGTTQPAAKPAESDRAAQAAPTAPADVQFTASFAPPASLAITNFDVQRVLFDGKLNKECGVAIKRYLLDLVDQGKVQATGQKRGRRYQWVQGN